MTAVRAAAVAVCAYWLALWVSALLVVSIG